MIADFPLLEPLTRHGVPLAVIGGHANIGRLVPARRLAAIGASHQRHR